MIPLTEVKSSSIHAVGHDDLDGLLVVFLNRKDTVYAYQGVTEEEVRALIQAKSVGKHFGAKFRNLSFVTMPLTTGVSMPTAVRNWLAEVLATQSLDRVYTGVVLS